MSLPTDVKFFHLESVDPWSWVPGRWVRAGTGFPTGYDRFYRLVRKEQDGWWCESVPEDEVGSPALIDRIRSRLVEFRVAAARADADLLRDEIMRLCNENITVNPERMSERAGTMVGLALALMLTTVHLLGVGLLSPWFWWYWWWKPLVPSIAILATAAGLLLVAAAFYVTFAPNWWRWWAWIPWRRRKR